MTTVSPLRTAACRVHNLTIGAAERLHRFKARTCSCCGWRGLAFRTYTQAEVFRAGVVCPGCGSFERHRALASFYPRLFADIAVRPARLIHCAPERCLAPVLRALCDRYETSGFGESTPSDHRLDLTSIALPSESCDALVMNHVLDCMPRDAGAAAEMHRVLRPGGVVVAVVTLRSGASEEVPARSNSLRRIYGSADVGERFAPLDVAIADAASGMAPRLRRTHGMPVDLPVLVMRKPARA